MTNKRSSIRNRQRLGAITITLLGIVLFLVSSGCASSNNFRDVEGVKSLRPDLIRNYNNMDKHPNIGQICIDGVAFATTTRNYGDALTRVPEWDKICPPAKTTRTAK